MTNDTPTAPLSDETVRVLEGLRADHEDAMAKLGPPGILREFTRGAWATHKDAVKRINALIEPLEPDYSLLAVHDFMATAVPGVYSMDQVDDLAVRLVEHLRSEGFAIVDAEEAS